ncbi:MAG: alpha/beta hydrolase [Myxococcota bacterium]
MRKHWTTLGERRAPYLKWNGSGSAIHFYGANGYPSGVYRRLLDELSNTFAIEALLMRPLWPDPGPTRGVRWSTYGDDLIAFLDGRPPVIGIGHSMGAAATLFAAASRPDLFSKVVLLEPAAVPSWMAALSPLVPFALRRRIFQPGKATLRRTNRWPSRAVFREKIRRWGTLKGLDDAALDDFAAHAVVDTGEGVQLAFPREWEAHNYFCPPSLEAPLAKVRCPIFVVRAEASMFFREPMWERWARRRPEDTIRKMDGYGHLLPLEAPVECAAMIRELLREET